MSTKLLGIWLLLHYSLNQCAAQVSPSTDFFETPAAASDNENFEADVVWTIGSSQTLFWTTSIEDVYTLDLWHNSPGQGANNLGTIYTSSTEDSGARSYTWNVSSLNNPSLVPGVFFFFLQDQSVSGNKITSHYFNISAAVTTTTSSTSSTSSTTSTSATSSTTTTATSTPTTSAAASSSESLAIGLGVGLGVGIPLILVLGALIAFKRFGFVLGRKTHAAPAESEKQAPIEAQNDMPPGYPHYEAYKPPRTATTRVPASATASGPASEMPALQHSPVELGPRY